MRELRERARLGEHADRVDRSVRSTLTATLRSSRGSYAANTVPIAPAPIRSRISEAAEAWRVIAAEQLRLDLGLEQLVGEVAHAVDGTAWRLVAGRGVDERLRGLELGGDAEQQILAAVRGDELDADRQAGGVAIQRDRARGLAGRVERRGERREVAGAEDAGERIVGAAT